MLQQDDPVHKSRIYLLEVEHILKKVWEKGVFKIRNKQFGRCGVQVATLAFVGYLVVSWMFSDGPVFFARSAEVNFDYSVLSSTFVGKVSDPVSEMGKSRVFAYVPTEKAAEEEKSELIAQFEKELHDMVLGYPIESMVPSIAKQDRTVAAFLIGIAKKESDWGKHVPRGSHGEDCYNYWGYRGPGSLGMQSLGYGCFASVEEAIDVVGSRIYELAIEDERKTPGEMVVWKCGSSCATHSPQSVRKWVSDVNVYYSRLMAG